MNPKDFELNVDQDGVLSDYNLAYRQLGGSLDEKGGKKFKRLQAVPHFYRDLPKMPGADKLWKGVKPYNPNILTAASNFLSHSRQDKWDWMQAHYQWPQAKVIVVDYPHDKIKHCKGKRSVLIDDTTKNCSEWINAGGTAIIYKNPDQALRELHALIKQFEDEDRQQNESVETPNVEQAFQELAEQPVCENVVSTFNELA